MLKVGDTFKFRDDLEFNIKYGGFTYLPYHPNIIPKILAVDFNDNTYLIGDKFGGDTAWVSEEMRNKNPEQFIQSKVSLNSFLKNEN